MVSLDSFGFIFLYQKSIFVLKHANINTTLLYVQSQYSNSETKETPLSVDNLQKFVP